MKNTATVKTKTIHVTVEAECPYCHFLCYLECNGFDDGDWDICDHCVEYDTNEFVFECDKNGIQQLKDITNDDKDNR